MGEGVVVRTVGWWGEYLAPGPRLWDTPLYCVLVGWLATAHIVYWSQRVTDIGYGRGVAVGCCVVTAFVLGLAGENLMVAAGIWVYAPSNQDWWNVPAFVPVSYGLGYGVLPFLRHYRVVPAALIFCLALAGVSVGAGLATGFFPR